MRSITEEILSTDELTEKYDAVLKNLLANKQFLARILKLCVPEYKDIDLWDIETKYIEPDISVSSVGVSRDAKSITGDSNEDLSKTEGNVYYNIMFHAIYPGKVGVSGEVQRIGLFINLEIQNNFYPGYPLPMRMTFYGARRLGSELPHVDKTTNYGQLQKVYSIWLCTGDNLPKCLSNTVTRFCIKPEAVIGNAAAYFHGYDLIETVLIGIRDEDRSLTDSVMQVLQAACSRKLTKREKLDIFKEEGIRLNDRIESEVDHMCTMGQEIAMQHEKIGEARGEARMLVRSIDALLKTYNSIADACKVLGLTPEDYLSAKALLSK